MATMEKELASLIGSDKVEGTTFTEWMETVSALYSA